MPITEEKALEVFGQLVSRVGAATTEGGAAITLTDATAAYGQFLDTHNKFFPEPPAVVVEVKKAKRKRRGGPPPGWPVGVGKEAYATWAEQQKKAGRAEAEITPQQYQKEDRAARAAAKRGEKGASAPAAEKQPAAKAPAKDATKAPAAEKAPAAKESAKTETKAATPAKAADKAPAKDAGKVAVGTAS
jgi:hypothetical protein